MLVRFILANISDNVSFLFPTDYLDFIKVVRVQLHKHFSQASIFYFSDIKISQQQNLQFNYLKGKPDRNLIRKLTIFVHFL